MNYNKTYKLGLTEYIMKKKLILISIFLSVLISLNFVSADTWWNDSWQYKKQINIAEISGANLTNYSTQINLTYNSNMNPNFSDLRFTNNLEDLELVYWIEDKKDMDRAVVWVKVPVLIANSNNSIYVYYGNNESFSKTNFNATFPLSSWSLNIAQGKNVSAQYEDASTSASNAVDGSLSTNWWGGASSNGQDSWFNIDLESNYLILKVGNYFLYTNHNEGVRNWSIGSSGIIERNLGIPQYTATQLNWNYKDYNDMSTMFSQQIGRHAQVFTDNIAGGGFGASMGEWQVYGILRADLEPVYYVGTEIIRPFLLLQNTTYQNINVTNTGFFGYVGNSIFRVVKGWFTEIDVITMTAFIINSNEINTETITPEGTLNVVGNLGVIGGITATNITGINLAKLNSVSKAIVGCTNITEGTIIYDIDDKTFYGCVDKGRNGKYKWKSLI